MHVGLEGEIPISAVTEAALKACDRESDSAESWELAGSELLPTSRGVGGILAQVCVSRHSVVKPTSVALIAADGDNGGVILPKNFTLHISFPFIMI